MNGILRVILFLALVSPAVGALDNDGDNRPVTKVINLLKDMMSELEQQGKEDQAIMDKMECWCKTNRKEKTQSIKDAESSIDQLSGSIEERTATIARLGTEMKNLETEIADNQESLAKATALREKQLAEFNAEEKDLLQAITSLDAAITVLGKHQAKAFLQVGSKHVENIAASLENTMDRHADLIEGVLTKTQRNLVSQFIQAAAPGFSQPYAPQSGQIIGILQNMKDTFESNLGASQKDETNNVQDYNSLKAAKDVEIKSSQDQVDKKNDNRAENEQSKADEIQELEETKESLAADQKFLAMLEEKCAQTSTEWEQRTATRQAELKACSEALGFLTSDEAHELFSKTFNPSFLQETSSTQSTRRKQAAMVLSKTAALVQNPRLSNLAVNVRLDAFTKVKAAIDQMVNDLLQEKDDEIKHKTFCNDGFNKNQLDTEKQERKKEAHETKIANLENKIETTEETIARLKKEIEEQSINMKRASEDREIANKEYQAVVKDQRATQRLLTLALGKLKEFYHAKEAAMMQEPVGPPPPAGFEEYKKNEQSGGVIGMIQQILDDAKKMEAEVSQDEQDAQKMYEDLVKSTNASNEQKTREVVTTTEANARAKQDHVQEKMDHEDTLQDLENLANDNAELHQSCDFVIQNFDMRQSARDEEVEALRQAKAILSGAQ